MTAIYYPKLLLRLAKKALETANILPKMYNMSLSVVDLSMQRVKNICSSKQILLHRTLTTKRKKVVALLTRLQCKQKVSETNSYVLTSTAQSRIQKAAEGLPTYSGSLFTKGFIKCRISRFQTHLERNSHFLSPGKGIWWDKDDMEMTFLRMETMIQTVTQKVPMYCIFAIHLTVTLLRGLEKAGWNYNSSK